jgi:hypothetical protein
MIKPIVSHLKKVLQKTFFPVLLINICIKVANLGLAVKVSLKRFSSLNLHREPLNA